MLRGLGDPESAELREDLGGVVQEPGAGQPVRDSPKAYWWSVGNKRIYKIGIL